MQLGALGLAQKVLANVRYSFFCRSDFRISYMGKDFKD